MGRDAPQNLSLHEPRPGSHQIALVSANFPSVPWGLPAAGASSPWQDPVPAAPSGLVPPREGHRAQLIPPILQMKKRRPSEGKGFPEATQPGNGRAGTRARPDPPSVSAPSAPWHVPRRLFWSSPTEMPPLPCLPSPQPGSPSALFMRPEPASSSYTDQSPGHLRPPPLLPFPGHGGSKAPLQGNRVGLNTHSGSGDEAGSRQLPMCWRLGRLPLSGAGVTQAFPSGG